MPRLLEELKGLILEGMPLGLAVLAGEELRFQYSNPAYRRFLGVPSEVTGERLEDALPGVSAADLELLRGVLRSGQPFKSAEYESTVLLRGGRPTFWNLEVIPLEVDDRGQAAAVAVLVLEVTEQIELRHEAERRAAEAEGGRRILDALMRYVPEGITIAEGQEVRIQRVSNYGMQLVGRGREQLEGLPAERHPGEWQIFTPDGERLATPEEVPLTRAVRTGEVILDERWLLRSSDGREILTASNAGPVRDAEGRVVGGVVAWRDITELHRIERALREREALLRLALDAAEMGYWEYDLGAQQVRYSATAARLHGLAAVDGVADVACFYERMHAEDRARSQREVQLAVQAGTGQFYNNYRIAGDDGEYRWLESRALIERDPAGQPQRMVGIDLDITEERRLRERLERFAHTVAHDLKAPLRNLALHAELVQRRTADPGVRDGLAPVLAACRQLQGLIDGVLDYARASVAGTALEPLALEQALADAQQRLQLTLREAGARLTHDVLPTVAGNRRLLAQVFQNLIGNAVKYRGEAPLRIHVGAQGGDGAWVISVRDNGRGIPREHQAHVFDAYRRGGDDDDTQALGLGLALVQDAVRYHGGRIWLESAPGAGTTFFFTLPMQPEAADGSGPRPG